MWTIRATAPGEAAVEKTLAGWGAADCEVDLRSQSISTLTFNIAVPDGRAALPFPYETLIELFSDRTQATPGGAFSGGERFFYGHVSETPKKISARRDEFSYVVSDPYWWLTRLLFQRAWFIRNGEGVLVEVDIPHFYLGLAMNGDRLNTGQEITNAVNYAASKGAPLQIDLTSLPDCTPNVREFRNAFCSEVIRESLRWTPDARTWFDYSTTPPTLHCRRRADLEAVTLTLPDPSSVDLSPRYELKYDAVKFYFEQTNSVDGVEYLSKTEQLYPPGSPADGFNLLTGIFDLRGSRVTNLEATIECETINSHAGSDETNNDPARLAWWKNRVRDLDDENVYDLVIDVEERDGSLPRQLTLGQITDWMRDEDGDPFDAEEEVIEAFATYYVKRPEAEEEDHDEDTFVYRRKLSIKIIATNAVTDTYTLQSVEEVAETVPADFAEQVYAGVSVLQYAGNISLQKKEVTDCAVGMGNSLNIANGAPEWATMAQGVTGIRYGIDHGTVDITIGPDERLGPDDILELIRASRPVVVIYNNPGGQQSGVSLGGVAALGSKLGTADTNGGAERFESLVVGAGNNRFQFKPVEGMGVLKVAVIEGCDADTGEDAWFAVIGRRLTEAEATTLEGNL